jgi:hypothetical protein
MDNPEKLATLCTLDTRRRQTKKNVQYSICWTPPYTRRRQTKPPKNIFDYRNCAILNLPLVKFSPFFKSYSDVIYLIHFQLCRFVTDYLSTCFILDMMW